MGLGNAGRCRPKKRFSERNSQALRVTHFLNQDKGFLKLAQRPHSGTSFSKSWNKLTLTPQRRQPWGRTEAHTKAARMPYHKHFPGLAKRSRHGHLSLEANFNSITDCILELLSHITCQHSHLPTRMCKGRWHLCSTSCCSRDTLP